MKIALPMSMGEKDPVLVINEAYANYLAGAKLEPILVAPQNDAKEIAKICDGLLLPGGKDIDPMFYGEENVASYWCDPDKDDFERRLMWAFADAGKRIFGICRGHQLIAREYIFRCGLKTIDNKLGYYQHVDDHSQTSSLWRRVASHYVDIHSPILFGPSPKAPAYMRVNSMHHQAVLVNRSDDELRQNPRITRHLYVTAWTSRGLDLDEDELRPCIAEGLLLHGWQKAPIMSVQWHPEEMKDYELIGNFFSGKSGAVPTAKVAAAE